MNQPREELLISKAIDGQATPSEWDELTAMAGDDPMLWCRVSETLRECTSFARAVNAFAGAADAIELPADEPSPGRLTRTSRDTAGGRFGAWGGWAVAAVVAITWALGLFGPMPTNQGIEQSGIASAELLRLAPAADLFRAYLDRGRQEDLVIGEVPKKVLIDSRPASSGQGYELLYLRQVLERAIVADLYQFTAQDELGRPTLVRFEEHPGRSM